MKRIFISLMLVFSMMFSFTSCEEDQKLAFRLSGYWYGNFGMWYNLNGKNYSSYESEIYFRAVGFETAGDGYELDYYKEGSPIGMVFHSFTWAIEDKNIHIYFDDPDEQQYNVTIFDYNLSSTAFSGYFGESKSRFTLHSTTQFDWNPNDFTHPSQYGSSSY